MRRFACVLTLARALLISSRASAEDADPIEVEVRGELLPRVGDKTLPTLVVDREATRRPGVSVAELLRSLPSLSVARTGGASDLATVSLRGGTSAQTPVFFGNIRLNDELTGTADLSLIPAVFLRRIEVFRGHAPIELAANGLTGAVVLVPENALDPRAAATFSFGSYGERSLSASGGAGDGRQSAALFLRAGEASNDYSFIDDRGTRFDASDDVERSRTNADSRTLDLWATSHLEAQRIAVDFLVRSFAREQGVPGLGVLQAIGARSQVQGTFASITSRSQCADGCYVEGSASLRRSDTTITDPNLELLLASKRTEMAARRASSGLQFGLAKADVAVRAGANFTLDTLAVEQDGRSSVSGRESRMRLFTGLSYKPADWAEFTAEGAVSSSSSVGANSYAGAPEARVGAALRPHEALELFASGGVYNRLPLIGERLGVSATVLGNPLLAPETGGSADLGARLRWETKDVALAAEAVGFARVASDLVAYQRSSFGALRPFNVGSARIAGLDVLAAARFVEWFSLGSAFNLTDARNTSEGATLSNDRLPFTAPWSVSPFAAVELRWAGLVESWSARASFDYRSSRFADPAGLIELPALLDLALESSLSFAGDRAELRLRVANLTNSTSTDLIGYPLPGPNAHGTLTLRWP